MAPIKFSRASAKWGWSGANRAWSAATALSKRSVASSTCPRESKRNSRRGLARECVPQAVHNPSSAFRQQQCVLKILTIPFNFSRPSSKIPGSPARMRDWRILTPCEAATTWLRPPSTYRKHGQRRCVLWRLIRIWRKRTLLLLPSPKTMIGTGKRLKKNIGAPSSSTPTRPRLTIWYAECLALQGRFDEAFAEISRARQLDPLSLIMVRIMVRITE